MRKGAAILFALSLGIAVPATLAAQSGNIIDGPIVEGQPTSNSATVSWTTQGSSSSSLRYGTDPNNMNQTASGQAFAPNPSGQQHHTVQLQGLNPGSTYYFTAVGDNGQVATEAPNAVHQFSTPAGATATPGSPAAANAPYGSTMDSKAEKAVAITSGPNVQNASGGNATLTWTTDKTAASYVEYSADGQSWKKAYERGGDKNHSVQLTGLQPGKTYTYKILTRDGDVRQQGTFTAQ
jgi:Purple acid Phosphatase, N-terminal domain